MEEDKVENALDKVKNWSKSFEVQPNFELQNTLIQEECKEFLEVMAMQTEFNLEFGVNFLKEISDCTFVILGFTNMSRDADADEAYLDDTTVHLIAGVHMVHSPFVRIVPELVELEAEAFDRVYNSNMSKLGKNGKPVRREDGKVMKGTNYKEPDLTDLAATFIKLLAERDDSLSADLDQVLAA